MKVNRINRDVEKVPRIYMKTKEYKDSKTKSEAELVDKLIEKLCERFTNSDTGVDLMFKYIEKVLEKRKEILK